MRKSFALRLLLGVSIAGFVALSVPTQIGATSEGVQVRDEHLRQLALLRQADLRVATIAFRLATQGTRLCKRQQPWSGMLVHDLAQYGTDLRPAARALFNLGDGPGVEAVVAGSPAALAGVSAGDRLLSIDGRPTAGANPGRSDRNGSFAAMETLLALLDRSFAAGPVTLGIDHVGEHRDVTVAGIAGCASQVQLVPGRAHNAGADGKFVTLSTAVVDDVRDDEELAFLIAHEFSHNILGHRVRLTSEGVSRGFLGGFGASAAKTRRTEEEADYLGLYLMASAGYDVAAVAPFWRRFDHQHGFGIFTDATHLNGGDRARFLQLTADQIASHRRRGETAVPDFASIEGLVAQARS